MVCLFSFSKVDFNVLEIDGILNFVWFFEIINSYKSNYYEFERMWDVREL